MKKIIALTALMIMSASTFAVAANTDYTRGDVSNAGVAMYGGETDTIAQGSTSPLFKLSTGVSVVINADDAGVGYALFTKHLKGTKIFATAYDSTAISFLTEIPKVLDATTTESNTAVPTGWTTM